MKRKNYFIEDIIQLHKDGQTNVFISQKIGLSESYISNLLRKNQEKYSYVYVQTPHKKGKIDEQIISKYKSGLSRLETAIKMNVDVSKIDNSIAQYHRQGGEKRKIHKKKIGELHNRAKLLNSQVIEIYDFFLKSEKDYEQIAKMYNISKAHVGRIIMGKTRLDLFENYKEKINARSQYLKQKRRKRNQVCIAIHGEKINYTTPLCPICNEEYPCTHVAKAK